MGKKSRRRDKKTTIPREKYNENTSTSTSNYSELFDNPMTRAAMAALSEDEKEKYREWGEHMFGNIDFEDSKALKNMPPPVNNAVAYIVTAIKSGILQEDLQEDEKQLMQTVFGDDWHKKYYYK